MSRRCRCAGNWPICVTSPTCGTCAICAICATLLTCGRCSLPGPLPGPLPGSKPSSKHSSSSGSAPAGGVLSAAQIGALWLQEGGSPGAEQTAECIAEHESGGNTQAI